MSGSGRRKSFWESIGETQTVVSLLILYSAIHFLVRFLLSPNLNGGEAAQMLFGQSFQWGYQPDHPPLMTWLAWTVLTVSNGSRLALFLLREIVFGIGLVAFFAAARTVLSDIRRAALATFFLLGAYGVGWLLHWGSMENVLLATMCCLYLWADTRTLTYQRMTDYVVLGAITGLGVLSSYIFLILPFAMAAALAFAPELRARLRPGPLLVAAVVAVIIVAPYFAFAPAAVAFNQAATRAPTVTVLRDFAVALVLFAIPALLFFAALYRRTATLLSHASTGSWMRFFRIAIFIAALTAVALILFLRPGDLRAWAYPVLLPLPLYLFARATLAYGGETNRGDKCFAIAVAACVVIGIGVRIGMYETRAHDCRYCAEYWPMSRYADTFRQAGFLGGTIAAPDTALAANLKLAFPDARVVTPDAPPASFGPPVPGECLVAWDGNGTIPPRLHDYVAQTYGTKLQDRAVQGDVEAMLLTSKTRRERMNFLILAEGSCDHPRT
ncbi:MAG TPA: glycosyltransferase family 39 protein [Rhizomicrobium sp.]|jgi:hypothetical protein|nr:glycosyltransferase family 39 protein [Rhizomicrobium sp.]